MSRKSQIDIFKVMSESELDEMIKIHSREDNRFYQRLIAMKLIQYGLTHAEIGKILGVSYVSVHRWAQSCEDMGLDGLEPQFTGGKASEFTNKERKHFVNILKRKKQVTIRDAQKILKEDFHHDFSIGYVGDLVRSLGFEYNTILYPENEVAVKTLVYRD